MSAIRSRPRSTPNPPSQAESEIARETHRRLAPAIAGLIHPAAEQQVPSVVEVTLEIKGRAETVQLPTVALQLFAQILGELAEGNAVTLVPIHAELTTQQAADLLNVSRPYLCKLLDEKAIDHRKVGRHRRVKLRDLLEYKKTSDAAQTEAMNEMVNLTREMNIGY